MPNSLIELFHRYAGPPAITHLTQRLPRVNAKPGAPRIAIEVVEESYYLSLFAIVAEGLSDRHDYQFDRLVTRSLPPGASRGPKHRVKAAIYSNRATDSVWLRAFGTFCQGFAYRSIAALPNRQGAGLRVSAEHLLSGCRDTEALSRLVVDDILIGDLVIDTYLRFKPAVSVDLGAPYLREVMVQTLRDLQSAQTYFSSVRPRLYLTTYTTYIQHGIAARVAVKHGVPVVAFGNLQETHKQITKEDTTHTRYAADYRARFEALVDSGRALEQAGGALRERLSGKIDQATAYMAKSAYLETEALAADVEGAVVIFLHDFYDSAHIYNWMIFHDFWDWAYFTISSLREAGIKVAVKPHPNQVAQSALDIENLKSVFPGLTFIPTAITNRQLVDAGVACAVTIYGTVAGEMAFMGVPAICCGDHPHVSFDFCHTARSREEYKALLESAPTLAVRSDAATQVAAFYYMHHMALNEQAAETRRAMTALWKLCLTADDTRAEVGDAIFEAADAVRQTSGFKTMIDTFDSLASTE